MKDRNTSIVTWSRFCPSTARAAFALMYPDFFQCVYMARTAEKVTFRLWALRGPRRGLHPSVYFCFVPLATCTQCSGGLVRNFLNAKKSSSVRDDRARLRS